MLDWRSFEKLGTAPLVYRSIIGFYYQSKSAQLPIQVVNRRQVDTRCQWQHRYAANDCCLLTVSTANRRALAASVEWPVDKANGRGWQTQVWTASETTKLNRADRTLSTNPRADGFSHKQIRRWTLWVTSAQ